MTDHTLSLTYARELDAADPLTAFRARFAIADPDLIYLDGNSLGRLPLATAERLDEVIGHEWGDRLIRSWNEGWFEAPNRIGDKLGHNGPQVGRAIEFIQVALAAPGLRVGDLAH